MTDRVNKVPFQPGDALPVAITSVSRLAHTPGSCPTRRPQCSILLRRKSCRAWTQPGSDTAGVLVKQREHGGAEQTFRFMGGHSVQVPVIGSKQLTSLHHAYSADVMAAPELDRASPSALSASRSPGLRGGIRTHESRDRKSFLTPLEVKPTAFNVVEVKSVLHNESKRLIIIKKDIIEASERVDAILVEDSRLKVCHSFSAVMCNTSKPFHHGGRAFPL
eukprot:763072-Hanusia_phi.AAC.4